MTAEAERSKEQDEMERDRVVAKNALESYCYSLKVTLEDENIKDKISDADKTSVTKACEEILNWLDSSDKASKEDIEKKQKELEAVARPIMSNIHQAGAGAAGAGAGGAGMEGAGSFGGSGQGPTIEEVD